MISRRSLSLCFSFCECLFLSPQCENTLVRQQETGKDAVEDKWQLLNISAIFIHLFVCANVFGWKWVLSSVWTISLSCQTLTFSYLLSYPHCHFHFHSKLTPWVGETGTKFPKRMSIHILYIYHRVTDYYQPIGSLAPETACVSFPTSAITAFTALHTLAENTVQHIQAVFYNSEAINDMT